MFLRAIAKILNVKESELEPKLVAPQTMETGWYDAIVVSTPFSKPSESLIVEWVTKFEDYDAAMLEIYREPSTAMLFDDGKSWANYTLFLQTLNIDEIVRVQTIAAFTKAHLDDREARQIIEDGKAKYKKRIAFASEITAMMAYLNESKVLISQQYIEQAALLSPVKEALTNASTTYARFLVDSITPDEVLVTTGDKQAILNEIDTFLASE